VVSGAGITTYNQPYEATSGALSIAIPGTRVNTNTMPGDRLTAASVAGSKIADATILGRNLHESALPLGTIIAYWVPAKPGGGYAIPDGWAVCNGQSLTAGSHNFAGGGTIQVPDLVDKVPRGTNPATAYTAYSGGAHQAGTGMNASIGANTLNLAHIHGVAHTHTIAGHSHQVADHTHGMSHTHQAFVPDHAHTIPATKFNVGSGAIATTLAGSATYGYGGTTITTDGGTKSVTDASGALSTINQTGGTVTGAASITDTASALTTTDIRDLSVGVLYLIKVKNTV
jgi:hypothetical protein